MTIIKRGIAAMLFVSLFTLGGGRAEAETYYTSSQASQIATLQALIAQLQAQLALMNGGQTYVPPVPGYAYASGDIAVTTGSVDNSSYGNISFTGTARFTRDNASKVWFEYGPTVSLTYSTPAADVHQYSGTKTFTMFADAVQPGALTYYRAAASDSYGRVSYGETRSFVASPYTNRYSYDNDYYYHHSSSHSSNFDRPSVTTDREDDVMYYRAELNGRVDMNDADNGRVFFIYGEDENRIERADNEDRYEDIDSYSNDLIKTIVDSNFDGSDDVSVTVTGLNDDTDIYYRLCVAYENDDTDDDELTCGSVRQFTTDSY